MYLRGAPICYISYLGYFDRFDDGKLNNSTLLNSLTDEVKHFLYYNGVVSKIRYPKNCFFENIKTSFPRICKKNADLESPGEGLAWSAKYSYTPWEYF